MARKKSMYDIMVQATRIQDELERRGQSFTDRDYRVKDIERRYLRNIQKRATAKDKYGIGVTAEFGNRKFSQRAYMGLSNG